MNDVETLALLTGLLLLFVAGGLWADRFDSAAHRDARRRNAPMARRVRP